MSRLPGAGLRRALLAVAPGRLWLAVALLAAGSYAFFLLQYALVHGPNGLFHIDTRWYAYLAYRDLGASRDEAIRLVAAFLRPRGVEVSAQVFTGPTAEITKTRVLYPLASAPFVAAFGVRGLLVVPALAALFTALAMAYLGFRLLGRYGGLLLVGAWELSWLVMHWLIPAMSDGLSIALVAAALLVLPLGRVARRRDVAVFAGVVAALAFTRQAAAIPAGAAILAWLWAAVGSRRLGGPWAPFAAAGAGAVLLTAVIGALWAPFDVVGQLRTATGEPTLAAALRRLPHVAAFIARWDLRVIALDPIMVTVLALCVACVAVLWRSTASALLLGATLPYLALNLLNATASGFRYAAPAYPVFFLAAAAVVAHWAGRPTALAAPPAGEPVR